MELTSFQQSPSNVVTVSEDEEMFDEEIQTKSEYVMEKADNGHYLQ